MCVLEQTEKTQTTVLKKLACQTGFFLNELRESFLSLMHKFRILYPNGCYVRFLFRLTRKFFSTIFMEKRRIILCFAVCKLKKVKKIKIKKSDDGDCFSSVVVTCYGAMI